MWYAVKASASDPGNDDIWFVTEDPAAIGLLNEKQAKFLAEAANSQEAIKKDYGPGSD